MRRFAIVLLWFLVGCGGKGDPDNTAPNNGAPNAAVNNAIDTPYFEAPPTAAALAETLRVVEIELEVEVTEDLRSQLRDYVTATSPAALSDPASETEAWIFLGVEAVLLKDLATAAWCFLQAYAIAPDDPWVLSQVGFALIGLDYRETGREALLRAYELDDEFFPTLLTLGFSYELDEEFARAVFFYLRAQALHPENIYFGFPVARAFIGVGRFDAAATLLRNISRALPDFEDVAEALEVAESSVTPEPGSVTPGGVAGGGSFWSDYGACSNQWLVDYTASVAPSTERGARVEGDLHEEFRAHQDASDACENLCQIADDACVASCWSANCGADQATLEKSGPAYIAAYWQWYGADTTAHSMWGACVFSSLYANRRHMSASYAKSLEDMIWDALQQGIEDRKAVFDDDVVPTIEGWSDEVAGVCDSAGDAIGQLNPYDILTTDPSEVHEMCGNGVCVKWDGPIATVDINVGGITINARGESMKGFTVSLGFDVWSNDNASVSVLMRFDSTGNQSLDVEGKVTGPLAGFEKKISVSTK